MRGRIAQLVAAATLILCAPGAAAAQLRLMADLTGAQVVPPTGSAATGVVLVTLNAAETQAEIVLTFRTLTTASTGAELRGPAAPGAIGPLIASITTSAATGGFGIFNKVLTPAEASELKAGLWYIDLKSSHFPLGELRGQIGKGLILVGNLSGSQAVPPNGVAAFGTSAAVVNGLGTHWLSRVIWVGLSGDGDVEARGPAAAGTTGPVIRDFGVWGPSGNLLTLSADITPTQGAWLRTGQWYYALSTTTFPNGEIRGQLKPRGNVVDFDSDNTAELAVFRNSGTTWFSLNPVSLAFTATAFGLSSDTRIPADFDGDGRTDIAVWRAGTFYVLSSLDGAMRVQPFGATGDDVRISADFDGDGRADYAVYRGATAPGGQSFVFVLHSLDGTLGVYPWGTFADVSVFGDYDGDRLNDPAVYRPSAGTFYVRGSATGTLIAQPWGSFLVDLLTPGDYDGDTKADFAVWRGLPGGDGNWYILQSATGTLRVEPFGAVSPNDSPVMADFDGDGKTDVAIARAGGGVITWYLLLSSTGALKAIVFGVSTDQPIHHYLRR